MSKKFFISFRQILISSLFVLIFSSSVFSQFTDRSRIILWFDDTFLRYRPSSKELIIAKGEHILSYGDEWEKCNVRPGIFHLKHQAWNFYMEVNTVMKEVYKITQPYFCRDLSTVRLDVPKNKLPLTVDVQGNPNNPNMFWVRFGDKVNLIYSPSSNIIGVYLAISTELEVLSTPRVWERCWGGGSEISFKHNRWSYFWKVNTVEKKVWKITGGAPCRGEGPVKILLTGIRVEVQE